MNTHPEIDNLRGKSSEEVARIVHAGQKYGDGLDYYDGHIALVKAKAFELCDVLGIDEETKQIIGMVCDFHDAPEDTYLKGELIAVLYNNKELGAYAEILNKDHLDGTPKSKDEYYTGIASSLITKITKAADRIVNVSKIPDTKKKSAQYLYNKYSKEAEYYEKYDVFYDLVKKELDSTQSQLQQREWL